MNKKNIQIDIWQFVRVMVEAENNPNGTILLTTYQDIWADVDNTLAETASQDMEKYAELMMETQVTLQGITREVANAIMEMAGEVIGQLTKAIPTLADDMAVQDYAFEIHGLEQLVDELGA